MTIEVYQNADLVICDEDKQNFQMEMENNSAGSSAEGQQGTYMAGMTFLSANYKVIALTMFHPIFLDFCTF